MQINGPTPSRKTAGQGGSISVVAGAYFRRVQMQCAPSGKLLLVISLVASWLLFLPWIVSTRITHAKEPNDAAGRLSRVGDGYKKLRDEQNRVEMRIAEAQETVRQCELSVANGVRTSSLINAEMQRIRDLVQTGSAVNLGELISQFKVLNNQLTQVNTQLQRERFRLTELTSELNRLQQKQLNVVQMGYKQQLEYWKAGDPFGRLSMEELQAVIKEMDRQLKLNHDNPGALCVRGITWRRLGNVSDAEADLTSVIAIEGPIQAVAVAARGELFFAQGKDREGASDFAKAVAVNKQKVDPRVLLFRGWVLCGQQRYEAARLELSKALRLGGVDAEAHRLMALIGVYYGGSGKSPVNFKEALDHALLAKKLTNETDWLSLEAYAAAQFINGDESGAIETTKKAIELVDGELKKRCEERLTLYQGGQRPVASWPDVFRRELSK